MERPCLQQGKAPYEKNCDRGIYTCRVPLLKLVLEITEHADVTEAASTYNCSGAWYCRELEFGEIPKPKCCKTTLKLEDIMRSVKFVL